MITKYDLGKELYSIKYSDNSINNNFATKNLVVNGSTFFKQYPIYFGDDTIQMENNNFVTKKYIVDYVNEFTSFNKVWLNTVKGFADFENFSKIPEIGDRYISETNFETFIKDHIYEYVLENETVYWKDTNDTKDGAIVYCIFYNGIDHGKVKNMLIYIESTANWYSLYEDVDISIIEDRVSVLEQNYTVAHNDILTINNTISNMQLNITDIESDIININSDITNINSDITNINSDITNINSDITNIKSDIVDINSDIDNINDNINTIETNVNNCVKLTDDRKIILSNTENNMQIGTLKLGTDISNSLDNILTNSSTDSILDTDVVTAGYLSNRGVDSVVKQTDTNVLNFTNTSNNFQAGTLKFGANSLNNALINSSGNSILNTDVVTAGYLSNRGVDSVVKQTDTNVLNFTNTSNNFQAGTLKMGSNTLNNILISSSANSTLNTDIVTAGYLSNKGVDSMVRRTDTNALTFSNTSNNFQAGTLKLGTNTSNSLNNILINTSSNSTINTDVVTAGYLSNRGVNSAVTRTDTNALTFSSTSNNIQAGTLKLGTNTSNSLSNILINSSTNSTANTDVVTAGYLSNRGVNSAVTRTDTNALTFSNTSNNIQAGTLKLGTNTSNSLSNILISSSGNSTANTDVVTAGYLSNRGVDSAVKQTDSNALNFTNTSNNIQAGTLKLGTDTSKYLNNILTDTSNYSTSNNEVVSGGYLNNEIEKINNKLDLKANGTEILADGDTELSEWKLLNFESSTQYFYSIASSGTIFVCTGTNGLYYSYDLVVWTSSSSSFISQQYYDIDFANGIFITAGNSGEIYKSTDGITWTNKKTTDYKYNGCRYINGLFFAVGGNIISYSSDGEEWTNKVITNFKSVEDINYFNEHYIICGQDGSNMKVAYFDSLSDTITEIIFFKNIAGRIISINIVNDHLSMTGSDGIYYTSQDGINWIPKSNLSKMLYYSYFYKNVYVVCGELGKIFTSFDEITWTEHTLATSFLLDIIEHDTYGLICCGYDKVILTTKNPSLKNININYLTSKDNNSNSNHKLISAGYLSNRGVDSVVTQTDSNALNFTNTLNNFQAGTLKFGDNSLNNVLVNSSANSILDTDIVTAGYLSNKGTDSVVRRTDTNALNFSSTTNNIQAGTLKLGTNTSNTLNNILISSSTNSTSNTDVVTAGYLSNKGVDSMVRRTDTNALNFSNTSNNFQAGTLKFGANSLNNVLIDTSNNSVLNTDVVTAGYLSNRDVDSMVKRTDTNALTFSSTSNNIQAGTLKLGTNTSNSLNNILINTSENSTANTDVVTAGYLSNRGVNSAVTRTDTNALNFSSTSNNFQANTLKFGANSLNNALISSSANSTLNTDVVTAGYLSNRGTSSVVIRTDSNILTFSNILNNFQVGTLKLGSNTTNAISNILINSSDNSILNSDVVTAGYLFNRDINSVVARTEANILNFSNTSNNIQIGTLKLGTNTTDYVNKILINTSLLSSSNNDIVTAGYLSNNTNKFVTQTDSNALNFSNVLNKMQIGELKLGTNATNLLNNILINSSANSTANSDVVTAGYLSNRGVNSMVKQTDSSALNFSNVLNNFQVGTLKFGANSLNNVLINSSVNSILDTDIITAGYLSNRGIDSMVRRTDTNALNFSNTSNNFQAGTLKIGSSSLNNILINSSTNSTLNTDIITAGYLSNRGVNSMVTQTDANILNFSNTSNNFQIGTLKLGTNTSNTLNNILTSSSTASISNTDVVTAGYLSNKGVDSMVKRTDSNVLNFTNTSNNFQAGSLTFGANSLNNVLISSSANSTLNTDIITAGYLSNRGVNSTVTRTDTNALTFSSTSNNIQAGTLKLGTNTSNILNNILTNSSTNSILNTDVVTAGYLSNRGVDSVVKQTDSNALNFSNTSNNIQAGTLKLGTNTSNYLNNILTDISEYSTSNNEVVSGGYADQQYNITSSKNVEISKWKIMTTDTSDNTTNNNFLSIATDADESIYVCGGNQNVYYSYDLINWSAISIPPSSQRYEIAYGNGLFVIAGNNNGSDVDRIFISSDAFNWKSVLKNTTRYVGCKYANNRYFGLGMSKNPTPSEPNNDIILSSSIDGINWTNGINNNVTGTTKINTLEDIIYYNNKYFVCGQNKGNFGVVYELIIDIVENESSTTTTYIFNNVFTSSTTASTLYSIEKVNDHLCAVGTKGLVVFSTTDGTGWTQSSPIVGTETIMFSFYSNNIYGLLVNNGYIVTSKDKITWKSTRYIKDVALYQVMSSKKYGLICVGSKFTVLVSNDAGIKQPFISPLIYSDSTTNDNYKIVSAGYLAKELNNLSYVTDNEETTYSAWKKLTSTTDTGSFYAIATYGDLFIASANGGIYCSNDLVNWNPKLTLKAGKYYDIDVNPTTGEFITAGGKPTTIYTSFDGIFWKNEHTVADSTFECMGCRCTNNIFFALSTFAITYRNSQGTWTTISTNLGVYKIQDAVYFNNKYIFVGEKNSTAHIFYIESLESPLIVDCDFPTQPGSTLFMTVDNLNGHLVAVGSNNLYCVSTDGVTWTRRYLVDSFGTLLSNVNLDGAYYYSNTGTYITYGRVDKASSTYDGYIYTSSDEQKWDKQYITNTRFIDMIASTKYGLVCAGYNRTILTSKNPTKKQVYINSLTSKDVHTEDNNKVVSAGYLNNEIERNKLAAGDVELSRWKILNNETNSNAFYSIASDGNIYVSPGKNKIYYSYDLIEWNESPSTLVAGDFWDIDNNGSTFICANNAGKIYMSDNGIDWDLKFNSNVNIQGCRYVNGRFFAVGVEHIIYSQDNGATWTDLTVTDYKIQDITYFEKKENNEIIYSIYIIVGQKAVGSNSRGSIAYFDSLIPSIETNKLNITDAVTASSNSSIFMTVDYINDHFVAVGNQCLFYVSINGKQWISRSLLQSNGTLWDSGTNYMLDGAIYYKNVYVVYAYLAPNGYIFTSYDEIYWNKLNIGTTRPIDMIIDNNFGLICSGYNKRIMISQNPAVDNIHINYLTSKDDYSDSNHKLISAGYLNKTQLVSGDTESSEWKLLNYITDNNGFHAIATNGDIFVCSALNGFYYSYDLIKWKQSTSVIIEQNYYDIDYGNGMFISAGSAGEIYKSINGIDWIIKVESTYIYSGCRYVNDKFFAVGTNIISHSDDGETWTNITLSGGNAFNGIEDINFIKDKYVLCGKNANVPKIAYFSDLVNVVLTFVADLPITTGNRFIAINNVNDRLVAVGSSGYYYTSENGTDWSNKTIPGAVNLYYSYFYKNIYVVCGDVGAVFTSTDEQTWTKKTPTNSILIDMVEHSTYGLICIGINRTVLTTKYPAIKNININYLTSEDNYSDSNHKLISGGYLDKTIKPLELASGDTELKEWKLLNSVTDNGGFHAIATNGNIFVCSAQNGIYYSYDLIKWTYNNNLPFVSQNYYDIDYGNGMFIVAGSSGYIYKSTDGIIWTQTYPSTTTTYTYNGCRFVDNKFFALGNNVISYSTDGESWIHKATKDFNWLEDIAYYNGRYVVCGVGNSYAKVASFISLEHDLTIETNFIFFNLKSSSGSRINSINILNGHLVLVGSHSYYFISYDGINWIRRLISSSAIQTHYSCFYDNTYVVCSNTGSIFTSTDEINWTENILTSNKLKEILINNTYGLICIGFDRSVLTTKNPTKKQININYLTSNDNYSDSNLKIVSAGYLDKTIKTRELAPGDTELKEWKLLTQTIDDNTGFFGIASNGNIYVCSAQNKLLYSYDLVKWYVSASLPEAANYWDIDNNGDTFITAGNNGEIYMSQDGINWSLAFESSNQFYGCRNTGNYYFALGNKIITYRSTLVESVWQFKTNTFSLQDIIYFNNNFFAVGTKNNAGSIVRFPPSYLNDNTALGAPTSVPDLSNIVLYTIDNLNGHLVSVGTDNTYLVSNDGMYWFKKTMKKSNGESWTGVILDGAIYYNGIYVVYGRYDIVVDVTFNGYIYTSYDEEVWERIEIGNIRPIDMIIDSKFGLICVGYNMSVLTTKNPALKNININYLTSEDNYSDSNHKLVSAGYLDKTIKSIELASGDTELSEWKTLTFSTNNNAFYAIASNNSTSNPMFVCTGQNGIYYSSDLIKWTSVTLETQYYYDVDYGNGKFMVAGYGGEIFMSSDCVNWDQKYTSTSSYNGVRFLNGYYFAVGVNIISYSSDGEIWIHTTPTSFTVEDINYIDDYYVICGHDGASGTNKKAKTGYFRIINGNIADLTIVAFTDNKNTNFNSINIVNNRFVLTGYSGYYFVSSDGINWTRREFTTTNLFCSYYYKNTYIACGVDGKMYLSSDELTWTEKIYAGANLYFIIEHDTYGLICAGNNMRILITKDPTHKQININYLTSKDNYSDSNYKIVSAGYLDKTNSLKLRKMNFINSLTTALTSCKTVKISDGINDYVLVSGYSTNNVEVYQIINNKLVKSHTLNIDYTYDGMSSITYNDSNNIIHGLFVGGSNFGNDYFVMGKQIKYSQIQLFNLVRTNMGCAKINEGNKDFVLFGGGYNGNYVQNVDVCVSGEQLINGCNRLATLTNNYFDQSSAVIMDNTGIQYALFAGGKYSNSYYDIIDIFKIESIDEITRLIKIPNNITLSNIADSQTSAVITDNLGIQYALFAGGLSTTYHDTIDIFKIENNQNNVQLIKIVNSKTLTNACSSQSSAVISDNIGTQYALFAGGHAENNKYFNTIDVFKIENNQGVVELIQIHSNPMPTLTNNRRNMSSVTITDNTGTQYALFTGGAAIYAYNTIDVFKINNNQGTVELVKVQTSVVLPFKAYRHSSTTISHNNTQYAIIIGGEGDNTISIAVLKIIDGMLINIPTTVTLSSRRIFSSSATITNNGTQYALFAGGNTGSTISLLDTIDVFTIQNETLQKIPTTITLSNKTCSLSSAVLVSNIGEYYALFTGGASHINTIDVYSQSLFQITDRPTIVPKRAHAATSLFDNTGTHYTIIGGGYNGSNLNHVSVFKISNNDLISLNHQISLSFSLARNSATTITNNKGMQYALFAGGNASTNYDTIDIFKIENGTLTKVSNSVTLTYTQARQTAVTIKGNDGIYYSLFIGGDNTSYFNIIDVYKMVDETLTKITTITTMEISRYEHATVAITDNNGIQYAIVAGGYSSSLTNSIEVFKMHNEMLVKIVTPLTLNYAISLQTATTIIDNNGIEYAIFASGFRTSSNYTNTIEIFKIVDGTLYKVPNNVTLTNRVRYMSSSTIVKNGVSYAIFAGGVSSSGNVYNTVDVFKMVDGKLVKVINKISLTNSAERMSSSILINDAGEQFAVFTGGVNGSTHYGDIDVFGISDESLMQIDNMSLTKPTADPVATTLSNTDGKQFALFAGGRLSAGFSNIIDVFSISNYTTSKLSNSLLLSNNKTNFASVVLNDNNGDQFVLFAGGYCSVYNTVTSSYTYEYTNKIDMFKMVNTTLTAVSNSTALTIPRSNLAGKAVFYNNTHYAIFAGGTNGTNESVKLNTVEIFTIIDGILINIPTTITLNTEHGKTNVELITNNINYLTYFNDTKISTLSYNVFR